MSKVRFSFSKTNFNVFKISSKVDQFTEEIKFQKLMSRNFENLMLLKLLQKSVVKHNFFLIPLHKFNLDGK